MHFLFKRKMRSKHMMLLIIGILFVVSSLFFSNFVLYLATNKNNLFTNGYNHATLPMYNNMTKTWIFPNIYSKYFFLYDQQTPAEYITWNNSARFSGNAMAVDNNGNIFVGGHYINDSNYDLFLIKFNRSGINEWIISWGSERYNESITNVLVDYYNNIIVTSVAESNYSKYAFLTKLSSNGSIIWKRYFLMGLAENENINLSIGDVFIRGDIITVSGTITIEDNSNIFITQYDLYGNKYSELLLDYEENLESHGVFVDKYYNIYIVGSVYDENNNEDMLFLKLNRNGDLLQYLRWGGPDVDKGCDIVVDEYGNIYIIGTTKSYTKYGLQDVFLTKLNSQGLVEWFYIFGYISIDKAFSLKLWYDLIIALWYTKDENFYLSFFNVTGDKIVQLTASDYHTPIEYRVQYYDAFVDKYGNMYVLYNIINTNEKRLLINGSYVIRFSYDFDCDRLYGKDELAYNTSPVSSDTDYDMLNDYSEIFIYNTSPVLSDTDNDGMPDGWEVNYTLDPLDPHDSEYDNDNDGLNNKQEFQYGTNPLLPDSDGDGISDLEEVKQGSNPLAKDTDSDGFIDSSDIPFQVNNWVIIVIIGLAVVYSLNIKYSYLKRDLLRKVRFVIPIIFLMFIYLVLKGILYVKYLDIGRYIIIALDGAIDIILIELFIVHFILSIVYYLRIPSSNTLRNIEWFTSICIASTMIYLSLLTIDQNYLSNYLYALSPYFTALLFAILEETFTLKTHSTISEEDESYSLSIERHYIPYILVIVTWIISPYNSFFIKVISVLILLIILSIHIYIYFRSYPEFSYLGNRKSLFVICLILLTILIDYYFITYATSFLITAIWHVIVVEYNIIALIFSLAIGPIVSFIILLLLIDMIQ